MRVATYVRVSTQQQDMRLQTAELGQYIASRGWTQADHYEDVMSATKASRPGLQRLMADAAARSFDIVIVWKLDRFGRSLVDCLDNIRTLERAGVRFIAITQGLDSNQNDPSGRFLLHILAAAPEFERSLIRERVSAGMKAAKKSGTALGRPKRVFNRDEVHELRRTGMSIAQISRQLKIGVGTVTRTLASAA
jgi:DNA invertase Pin-like site-specific DNA recombinase